MFQGVGCSMRTGRATPELEAMARQTSPKTKQTKAAAPGQATRTRTGLADRKEPGKKLALDLVLQLLAAGEQSKPYHTDHQVWLKSRLLGKQ